jgi:hypothetical protein
MTFPLPLIALLALLLNLSLAGVPEEKKGFSGREVEERYWEVRVYVGSERRD